MNKQKNWLLATGMVTAAVALSALWATAATSPARPAPERVAVAQTVRSGPAETSARVLSWGYPIGWGSEHEARMPFVKDRTPGATGVM